MTIDATDRRAPVPPTPSGHFIATLAAAAFGAACLLKLAGVVSCSWALILAPIWLPWACGFVFTAAALILAVRK